MTNIWKKAANDYISSAKVVDGNLILSLPDAINPIVWRMELGSVKASALEVRPHSDGSFMLFLKTPRGETHDIAPYTSKEQAVRALMNVSSALQNAHGKIAPPSNANTVQDVPSKPVFERAGLTKWLVAVGGILLVIFLFAYMNAQAPRHASVATEQMGTTTDGSPSNAESGVPQSADQLLKGF